MGLKVEYGAETTYFAICITKHQMNCKISSNTEKERSNASLPAGDGEGCVALQVRALTAGNRALPGMPKILGAKAWRILKKDTIYSLFQNILNRKSLFLRR